jgi:hypothetical protein
MYLVVDIAQLNWYISLPFGLSRSSFPIRFKTPVVESIENKLLITASSSEIRYLVARSIENQEAFSDATTST